MIGETMSTRDLVNAIVAGNAVEIETAFQSVMAEKISSSLDDYRQEVAKSMFKTEQVELSEEKHRVQVTVSEPDHPSVAMRKATKQKFIRLTANDETNAVERAKAHYKKQGYKVHGAEHVGMVKEGVELDEGQLDELDQLALRGMYSTDPKSKQHVGVTTDKGKAARAKRNLPDLKGVIKASSGKHPKANLPEEVELEESLAADFLAHVKKTNPNAKLAGSVADQKKERDAVIAKREKDNAGKPKAAPQPYKEKYPLGGRDEKSGRSYSEEVQIEQLQVSNIESAMYALEEGRGVLDVGLDEAVSSDSKGRYEYSNGKKPSGRGNWMFSTVKPSEHDVKKHADQTVSVQGTFGDAAKKAAAHFKEKGHKGEIHVMP